MSEQLQLQTYTEQAYRRLRRMILGGEIAQGTKLTVRVLAERLGLSPTPIKSALMGLEREGYIVSSAHRGFSVPRVRPCDVADAFELLEILEVYAAQKLARSPERESVLQRLDAHIEAPEDLQGDAEDRWRMTFHRLVWEGCGNAKLVQVAENLRGLILIASGGVLDMPGHHESAHAEHAQMVEAMRDGDVDLVTGLQRVHSQNLARAVKDRLFGDADNLREVD
ncbi:GntR family transcriptional regulator [Pseudactinotalea terrae]|uniref:GntR family transcriptional regulator n=1 Tax=Pseudactinotalea terrae TaxID=1743262 RepID=UPI0012E28A88|nr:GntR family transcriptional regulator [Pseudactinotalea terrae]